MTGAFIRIKRDGIWQNIEVEHLSDSEREERLKDDPRFMNWLHLVCHALIEAEDVLGTIQGMLQGVDFETK